MYIHISGTIPHLEKATREISPWHGPVVGLLRKTRKPEDYLRRVFCDGKYRILSFEAIAGSRCTEGHVCMAIGLLWEVYQEWYL